MESDIVKKIVDRLEELKMYDAAIEVIKISSYDNRRLKEIAEIRDKYKKESVNNNQQITYLKSNYFYDENNSKEGNSVTLYNKFETQQKNIFINGLNEFNKGNYREALEAFLKIDNEMEEQNKVFVLTYICLCQYKMNEFTSALKTINSAIEMDCSNNNLNKIRGQIIDRLEIVESKSKFVEEYYSKGTYMGEIMKNSLELYHRIDNIEVKNKNILKRIPEYINEIKKIYVQQKARLEKDLSNADELIINAEKNVNYFLENEEVKRMANSIERFELSSDVKKVFRVAEILYLTESNDSEIDYSYIVFSYCKAVEMLGREKLLKYFMKNRGRMPIINDRGDYNRIGINSYDAEGIVRYSFAPDFKVQASDYLVEINKHISLRKAFKGKEHLMPWEKLRFISHCIKTGKDPIDGTKSAGILLLFYCAYKNYMGIVQHFDDPNELVVLGGDLIRLQNERNLLMHSKILENKDSIDRIRELTFKCIDKLTRIE